MGFLDWVRRRNEKRRVYAEFRKAFLQEWIDVHSTELQLRGFPPESWQFRISPGDAEALTGKPHEPYTFFRWPCAQGSIRIAVWTMGDRKPMRERPTDPTPP